MIQALLALKDRVAARRSSIPTHPDTGLSRMEARLNINMIHGGLKVNIAPDQCTISVDRRLIPEEDLSEAEQEITDALNSVKTVEWEIIRGLCIPTVAPCSDPMVDELAAVIENVTGQTGKYGEMGSGDLCNIVHTGWGGQEFGLGVIRTESNIHGKHEFVRIKDVVDLGRIIALFLQ